MTDGWDDDIVLLILSVLAGAYVTPRLPPLPEDGLLGVLSNSTTQIVLVIVLFFVVGRALWRGLYRLATGSDVERTTGSVYVSSNPPDNPVYTAKLRYSGVDWEGAHGYSRGNQITHITGPYCPDCTNELDTRTTSKYLIRETTDWYCASCGYSTERNHPADGSQEDAVESFIETEATHSIQAFQAQQYKDVRKTIEQILNRAVEINPDVEGVFESPETAEVDEALRDAVHQAIDEVVDDTDIQQTPELALVLTSHFDYDTPERNYTVLTEDFNAGLVRKRLS